MLAGLAIDIRSPQDFGLENLDVPETGKTFAENARRKATAYARAAGIPALADDTGLCVSALDSAPGLQTARFGGPGLNDADRRQLLLRKLKRSGKGCDRRAEFRCVVCVAAPHGTILCEVEGVCPGYIAETDQSGPFGFGYDPLFIPSGYALSFSQLPDDVKDRISHRGRAIATLRPQLEKRLIHREIGR